MDRDLGSADEVRERLALAACRECRVEHRRRIGAAVEVRVADGRLAVRAGERDLPGTQRSVGIRDRRLRLLAGEPAKFRVADAHAGQDPAFVLLAPCVQDAATDADSEQEGQDERHAEAEGERPSAPSPCRGLVLGHGGYREQGGVGVERRLVMPDERRELGVARGRRGVGVVWRCVRPDERGELGVAGGRLVVGCRGDGLPVGCGFGQFVGH